MFFQCLRVVFRQRGRINYQAAWLERFCIFITASHVSGPSLFRSKRFFELEVISEYFKYFRSQPRSGEEAES